jgi:hypothetical protein
MTDAKKCAHPACSCVVTKDKYCSETCGDAKGMIELTCQCHHPECKGEVLKA